MKKILRKLVCFSLCFFLLFTVPVFAQTPADSEYPVAPCYSYVTEFDLTLEILPSGKASCGTSVFLSNSNHSCKLEMVLQRDDGSGWDDVKTWTYSGEQDLIAEQAWYVASGYDYRIQSTLRVYNANDRLIETITEESAVAYY